MDLYSIEKTKDYAFFNLLINYLFKLKKLYGFIFYRKN